MEKLAEALAMTAQEIAAELGVTARTVRAWISGTRGPAERNRVKLARLVTVVQRELSASKRWTAARDEALRAVRLDLMSADERAIWEANRARMQEQFAAPVPAQRSRTWAEIRDGFAAANARQSQLFLVEGR